MSGQKTKADDEARSLAAARAAGYCWAKYPAGPPGRCTRRPGHNGDHVDYYAGRPTVTSAVGYVWPQ
ncbi:hypothetical protein ACWEQ7_21950 [Streptomyces sp. NPDC004069]